MPGQASLRIAKGLRPDALSANPYQGEAFCNFSASDYNCSKVCAQMAGARIKAEPAPADSGRLQWLEGNDGLSVPLQQARTSGLACLFCELMQDM